ncbi:DHA2 family efflux MFS transporter permease subunit [Paenibacillus albicereus]|uniref:DHA2 family efflux MFS transporter permease subunit n=1 Tax=Paenibacillus albicereus TaxID=2726185 RepID=A0A6H2GUD4_9BACL|nr:DHA2 family efflux MFS transporter permease subunit [Paenibacillus albicereus]QJC51043.1 DHA2 family efflux MFS transporter permease subunit [Paenibacillus albicereus]
MPETTFQPERSGDDFSLKAILMPLLAIIIGMIMIILDSTVVNNAIPKLVDYFDTDLKTIQWTVTGYTLALSAVIPLAGWMADRFGAKQVFLVTIALFTVGSVLCGIARTPEELILYRVIQGLGGGMVGPIGLAMVFKLAPPERRGSVMGLMGIPMLMAPAFGPVLSGWLVDAVSWHWIFIINLPIGVLALILAWKFLPRSERHEAPHLDVYGMLLAPVAFSMLAYGLTESGTSWTSASTITGLAVGGAALVAFIFVELSQKQPLLELRAFRSSDFTRSIILTWIVQLALFGAMLILPLYLQRVFGYTALETGWILMPYAVCAGIGMPISGRLFDRIGARPLAFAGLAVVSAALFLLSGISLDTPLWTIILYISMMGLGMSFAMMPLNTHVLNSAPRGLVSRVTPLTTAAQQVVVSFAAAGLTGYLTSRIAAHGAGGSTDPLRAAVLGYGDTFFLSASLTAAGVALTLLLRRPRHEAPGPAAGEARPGEAMTDR